jgi:hypothetical protein
MKVQLDHLFSCSKILCRQIILMKILSHCQKMRSEIHKLKPEDLEYCIIENSITNSRTNGPNEDPTGSHLGALTYVCTNETYQYLLGIIQTTFTTTQFEYLIKKMQMCHFTDKQLNNLKAILFDRDGFTDDQWNTVSDLLSENRLNDKQFGIFVDMLDTLTQKLLLLHEDGGTGKTFVTCNFFEELALHMKFVIAHVQLVLVLCTYHKAKLSTVFSGHGHPV